MINLLPFLIQSSIALVVFYLYFYFFLRKSRYFQLNRIYLIVSSVFAVVIPFLRFPDFDSTTQTEIIRKMLQEVTVVANYSLQSNTNEFAMIQNLYILGIIIFSFLFCFKVLGIYKILHKCKFINKRFYKLVEVSDQNIAFSFFSYIFLSKEFINENKILSHELVHVNQKHSIDVVLINIIKGILWFNPIVYFYIKAIQENHEYIADKEVIKHHSAGGYLQLLLSQTMSNSVSIISCFAQSNLKKRVIMMKKQKIMRFALVKYISAFTLPVVMLFAISICNEANAAQNVKKEIFKVLNYKDYSFKTDYLPQSIITDTIVSLKADVEIIESCDEDVFVRCDKMPEYNGGPQEMYKFLAKAMRYPEKAHKNKKQGRVFVGFVVEKDGSISHVKVLRPVDPSLDKEACRVIKSMPKWTPGYNGTTAVRVSYTCPVNFRLK